MAKLKIHNLLHCHKRSSSAPQTTTTVLPSCVLTLEAFYSPPRHPPRSSSLIPFCYPLEEEPEEEPEEESMGNGRDDDKAQSGPMASVNEALQSRASSPCPVTNFYTSLSKTETMIRVNGEYTFENNAFHPSNLQRTTQHQEDLIKPLYMSLKAAQKATSALHKGPLANGTPLATMHDLAVQAKHLFWTLIDNPTYPRLDLWDQAWGIRALLTGHTPTPPRFTKLSACLTLLLEPQSSDARALSRAKGDMHTSTTLLMQWLRDGGLEDVAWGNLVLVVERWMQRRKWKAGVEWGVVGMGVGLPGSDDGKELDG